MRPVLLTLNEQQELAAIIAELFQVLEKSLRGERVTRIGPITPVGRVCLAPAPLKATRKASRDR